MPVLLVEVTWAQEAATSAEAARVAAVLVVETFAPRGCCGIGQHRPLCRGCGRPGHPGREGEAGADVEIGGGDQSGISLYSRGCRRLCWEERSP
jgi:hypothetical protein